MAKRDSNFNPIGKSRGIKSRSGGVADWTGATEKLLVRAIATAAKCGGALRLGYSRDGGAYAVGIYGDGEPYTLFWKPSEDIDVALQDIIDLFEAIADEQVAGRNGA